VIVGPSPRRTFFFWSRLSLVQTPPGHHSPKSFFPLGRKVRRGRISGHRYSDPR